MAIKALNDLIDITPSALNTWVLTDLSANVPAGAQGVICVKAQNHKTGGNPTMYAGGMGVRFPGITTIPYGIARTDRIRTVISGCNASRQVEVYSKHVDHKIYLAGYVDTPDVVLPNPIRIPFTSADDDLWATKDLSTWLPTDATVALFTYWAFNGAPGASIGARHPTSTSTLTQKFRDGGYTAHMFGWGLAPVNASRQVQLYNSQPVGGGDDPDDGYHMRVYLHGYVKSSGNFLINPTSVALAGVDLWTDIDVSAYGTSTTGLVFVQDTTVLFGSDPHFGFMRRKGSTAEYLTWLLDNAAFLPITIDSAGKFQGRISHTAVDHWLHGISLPESTPPQQQTPPPTPINLQATVVPA